MVIDSPDAAGSSPPPRLHPRLWRPSSAAGRIDLRFGGDPLAPPLLLLIDRGDPAVTGALSGLAGVLAPVERERLARLHRVGDRERFLLGRAVLRLCLGELLDRPPADLELATGPRGKPFLADREGSAPRGVPRFNVAHSGELVLLAFHRAREVGVDVERHRPELDWRPIARRCLPRHERSRIENLPPDRQGMAFLQAWCALEAALKARGVGLFGLERPEAGQDRLEAGGGEHGLLWPVALPSGYAGAAALA